QILCAIEHVTLSELHRTIEVQERSATAQMPELVVLTVLVNEKHSQSRFEEHGKDDDLQRGELHVAKAKLGAGVVD
ncbi:unnamed protein product, partial [Rotaria sp. Silwood1]